MTKDERLRYQHASTVVRHGLQVICYPNGNINTAEQLGRALIGEQDVIDQLATRPGPWLGKLYADGFGEPVEIDEHSSDDRK